MLHVQRAECQPRRLSTIGTGGTAACAILVRAPGARGGLKEAIGYDDGIRSDACLAPWCGEARSRKKAEPLAEKRKINAHIDITRLRKREEIMLGSEGGAHEGGSLK